MTLILTQLSKHGLILASDSNLSSNGQYAGEARKVFPISFLRAGLCVAGVYEVQKRRMDEWLDNFITTQAAVLNLSLAQFAHNLKEALEAQMLPAEKQDGCLIHIAGYVEENGQSHPEFWFVRNIHGINENTWEYIDFREDFAVAEDFWRRDCQNNNSRITFENGGYQLYINGFTAGRVSYQLLQRVMNRFFFDIWHNPNWEFRPPASLQEMKAFIELYMQCINTLFLSSNYTSPYIGGKVQIYEIPAPDNTVINC